MSVAVRKYVLNPDPHRSICVSLRLLKCQLLAGRAEPVGVRPGWC